VDLRLIQGGEVGERTRDAREGDAVRERERAPVPVVVSGGPDLGRAPGDLRRIQAVRERDAAGLVALRDAVGDRFAAGVVLHLGQLSYRLADRIRAIPLDRLWLS
jgi:hypothetical protein